MQKECSDARYVTRGEIINYPLISHEIVPRDVLLFLTNHNKPQTKTKGLVLGLSGDQSES